MRTSFGKMVRILLTSLNCIKYLSGETFIFRLAFSVSVFHFFSLENVAFHRCCASIERLSWENGKLLLSLHNV